MAGNSALKCFTCAIALFATEIDAIMMSGGAAVRKNIPPNIVFMMTDSMDGRFVDPQSREAQVVDMDFLRRKLGKAGATFVNSYSNNPLCVPSRSSTMTGRRSDQIHVWNNWKGLVASPGGVLDESCVEANGEAMCREWAVEQGYPKTIFSVLRDLGYRMQAFGRVHIGAGLNNQKAHADQVKGNKEPLRFIHDKGAQLHQRFRGANIPRYEADFRGMYTEDVIEDQDVESPHTQIDWNHVQSSIDFINSLPPPEEATEPFFLYVSLVLPHYKYSTNSTWLQRVHTDKMWMPTWLEGFPENHHPYDIYMSLTKGVDGNYSAEEIMRLQRVYFAMVAEADAMLGKVYDALIEKGYGLDNTYVISVSDHGEMRFEHRQVMKSSMYEGSTRVPFQIAGPGIKPGARIDDRVVSLMDVFPTLLDMAATSDAGSYEELQGMSLLAAAGGHSVAPKASRMDADKDNRDFILTEYNADFANTACFMVRSGNWKYVTFGRTYAAFKDYPVQLFNLEDDPEELENVAEENPDVVSKIDKRLREEIDPDKVSRDFEYDTWKMLVKENKIEHVGSLSSFEDPHAAAEKLNAWLDEASGRFGTAFS